MTDLDQLLGRRQGPAPVFEPLTAVVVRSDASGVWAVPLGEDTRHPVGPCRGVGPVCDGGVPCRGVPPSVGTVVLLILTQERPWVLS